MNPTQLDLPILALLVKGLILLAPLSALLLLLSPRISARTSSLGWRTILVAALALPLITWTLPGLPLLELNSLSASDQAPAARPIEAPALATPGEAPPMTASPAAPLASSSASPTSWIFLIWLSGSLLLGARLLLGHIKANALRKNSLPFTELDGSPPSSVVFLRSSDTGQPLSCGLRKPAIIFPEEAANWDKETRHAVLTHELTHIRRRDLFFMLLSSIAVALHWPNPLVWFAARRLRLADERAADDAVLDSGVEERPYAQLLFDLARGNQTSGNCLAAQFMAKRSMIGSRIKCLLDDRQNRNAPRPFAVAGSSILALAATLLVGTATFREASAEPAPKNEHADEKKGQEPIATKLKNTIIPMIDFEEATLQEAVDFLRMRSKELDPEPDPKKKGINIIIQLDKDALDAVAKKPINLNLKNVPLSMALKYTAEAVGLKYQVTEFAVEIVDKQAPPVPAPKATGNKSEAQKFIDAKLKNIRIPVMHFEDATIHEAVEFLRSRSRELDPEPDPQMKGINILIRLDKKELAAVSEKRITLKLRDVPLGIALEYVAKATGLKLSVSDFAAEIGKE